MLHSSLPKRVSRKKPKTQISHAIVGRWPLCVPLFRVGLFWKWLSLEMVVFLVMHYLHSLHVTIVILPISVRVSIYIYSVYIFIHTKCPKLAEILHRYNMYNEFMLSQYGTDI